MKRESDRTRVYNGEATNLLLFPDEPSTPTQASPLQSDFAPAESFRIWSSPPSLSQVTADWQLLLKRLGRRRRVLETILSGGRPIRLTDDTLVVGFPPQRRFHRELLDMPDYRMTVEAELARMFRVRLSVVTALHPESSGLRRNGIFGNTPA